MLRNATKSRQTGLVELERERFAIDHRYLTDAMLTDWGLPRIYCDGVRGHELCDEALFRKAAANISCSSPSPCRA
ncbi:MAG: HDOD domain-containing protein [Rhodocyclaceae bacterium]|nr:HDOD domain-containing protein [Rhodocyclaceae bacterium]